MHIMQSEHNVIKQICNWTKGNRKLLKSSKPDCFLSDHFPFQRGGKEIRPKKEEDTACSVGCFFGQDISWPWKWVVFVFMNGVTRPGPLCQPLRHMWSAHSPKKWTWLFPDLIFSGLDFLLTWFSLDLTFLHLNFNFQPFNFETY